MPISPTRTVKRVYSSAGIARRLRTSKMEPALDMHHCSTMHQHELDAKPHMQEHSASRSDSAVARRSARNRTPQADVENCCLDDEVEHGQRVERVEAGAVGGPLAIPRPMDAPEVSRLCAQLMCTQCL